MTTFPSMTCMHLQTVERMHAENFIHGDIKTSNIFMCEDGHNVKLGDFGNACQVDGMSGRPRHGAAEWFDYGTPGYRAADGSYCGDTASAVDLRACDVFALGMVSLPQNCCLLSRFIAPATTF